MKNRLVYIKPGNRWMHLIVTLLFFIRSVPGFSQTTNISGVVNTYHSVIEIIPSKACVRVNSTAGLSLYKKILLIQMKGASVVQTDAVSFGDTTSLNNAGNYEVSTICNIIGDSVFMFYSFLNNYTVADKVQLVQFGQYTNAIVTDTIKATPWNNSTGTGGVIALYVYDNLTLNAPVFANAAGFNGGAFYQSSGDCGFFYPAPGYIYNASSLSPQYGAGKGENVYELPASQSGGRGAPANGGGGGNNHNNSGGGGANLSAGGLGGGNSSTAACTATLRGLAGKALSSWGGKKIFSGGGGGAGHNNGGFSVTSGGNGGGIIIIRAANIFGNGYKITANGGAGSNSLSDGAGGGGGGGTIIMSITNYSGNENFEVKGGNGGNSNDGGNSGRCYGGGGGGSGGVIYFNGSTPAVTISTSSGTAGSETDRDAACAVAQPAAAGSNGPVINSYSYRQSLTPAAYCTAPLQVQLSYFTANAMQRKIRLQWEVLNPAEVVYFEIERLNSHDQWEVISNIQATTRVADYIAWDDNPMKGKNSYRLKIIELNNRITYSVVRQVFFDFDAKDFAIYPNPAKNSINLTGDFYTPALFRIFDYSGKLVYSKRIVQTKESISLPVLSPGIYITRLNEKIKKLVIY